MSNERRELFRQLGRAGILAGMAAFGVMLGKRGQLAIDPPDNCSSACAKCPIGEDCSLPRAEKRRQLLGSVRGKEVSNG
jgi:hypothetical protein